MSGKSPFYLQVVPDGSKQCLVERIWNEWKVKSGPRINRARDYCVGTDSQNKCPYLKFCYLPFCVYHPSDVLTRIIYTPSSLCTLYCSLQF